MNFLLFRSIMKNYGIGRIPSFKFIKFITVNTSHGSQIKINPDNFNKLYLIDFAGCFLSKRSPDKTN